MTWKTITRARFWEALEALPPALMQHNGFLLGEPYDLRTCQVTGKLQNTYAAFVETTGDRWAEDGKFWEHEPMTVAEFKAVNPREIANA